MNLEAFKDKKILVIGDIGLDEYINGEVNRISPEAPVPILEAKETFQRLGLAANVAANIKSLGGEPYLIGLTGDDQTADDLLNLLVINEISPSHIVMDNDRPTTKKLRMMNEQHHMLRIDFESKNLINESIEEKLMEKIDFFIPIVDAVIIEDYAKGMLSDRTIERIISRARQKNKLVCVDPHSSRNIQAYIGASYITPNSVEALKLSGDKDVESAGDLLLEKLRAKAVIVTRGKDGMSIFEKDRQTDILTAAQKVFDVTGAGDTVIAALTLGLVSGQNLYDACKLANYAAGIAVGKIGCATVNINELETFYKGETNE